MSVCLVGNYSLDELEQLARENFSEVIDKDLKVKSYEDDPMYGQDTLGHLIKFIPIKELRRLTIKWPQLP
jgi:secreted Zn-dependent insulinase-like peptidase